MNFIDHIGNQIQLSTPPKRIVSLVPSITELLFDLGLQNQIVGRTKFCIYPTKGYPSAEIIGGTKNVHVHKIHDCKPDLVIANKEENVKEQVELISKYYPTFTTVIKNRNDALKMISDLGQITGTDNTAKSFVNNLVSDFAGTKSNKDINIVYLIWKKPFMTIGGDTFISSFLADFGLKNCYSEHLRYPEISLEEIKSINVDYILLSSEPYPFNEQDAFEIEEKTGIKAILVDGSYCSWYGSRMLKSQDYLRHLCNKLS